MITTNAAAIITRTRGKRPHWHFTAITTRGAIFCDGDRQNIRAVTASSVKRVLQASSSQVVIHYAGQKQVLP